MNDNRKQLVVFDFDGTLTTHDTLLCFIRSMCSKRVMLAGFLRYSPQLVLMKLRLYPNGKAKQALFGHFFAGMWTEDFSHWGRYFAKTHRHLLRPQGMATLRAALDSGAQVAVVSASITDWVRPFFEGLDVEVIGTEAEGKDGELTGRFSTPNCYGAEKVRRLLQRFPDRENYRLTVYGDSRGDRELMALADEAHYKPFRD